MASRYGMGKGNGVIFEAMTRACGTERTARVGIGGVSRRSASRSTGLPGITFHSFVFFCFFRPHRFSLFLIRSGFAERNAKDAGIEGASRRRRSVLGVAMTCLRFRRGGLRGWRATFPMGCEKASRHDAKAQRFQDFFLRSWRS